MLEFPLIYIWIAENNINIILDMLYPVDGSSTRVSYVLVSVFFFDVGLLSIFTRLVCHVSG